MSSAASDTADAALSKALRSDESLADTLYFGAATVGVTDRRLLVRQDDRTRAVDLTNVEAVRRRTRADTHRLFAAIQWAIVAVVLFGGWLFAPLDGLAVAVDAPPGTGFQGLFATVDRLVGLLGYIDEAFLLGGVATLLLAGGFVAVYLHSRAENLEVIVAGFDPIVLPPPPDDTAVHRLRGAVDAQEAESAS